MSSESILPPNASDLERDLEAATARLGEVPVPLRTLWNPDTCPSNLLPWLAWALSVDAWKSYWPEAVKRQVIKDAIPNQRRKGTTKSVRDVVASFGGALSLVEWWQKTPPGPPHTFEVQLTFGGGAPSTAQYQQDVIAEVERTKSKRSHFDLVAGLTLGGGLGLQGALRPVTQYRLSTRET